MKQNTPFTQRRHAHILNLILNRSLSLVLSLALSLSACHPDSLDDLDGDNDSGIALTHFLAEILTPTDGITTIPTAARTRSDGTDDKGYTGLVKTRFIPDDVIHIVLTDADNSNAIAYSTATLQQQDGSAPSPARWIISPAMSTPQNGNFELLAFYNGQTAPYIASSSQSAPEAALKAYIQAERGSLFTTAPGTPPYVDALTALYSSQSGNQTLANDPLKPSPGALNLASGGTLTASFQHRNAIINISGITNQLGAPVNAIRATIYSEDALNHTLPLTPIADATEAGNGACQWQAISRLNLNASYQSSFYLHSLTVTLGGTVNRDPDTGLNTVTGGTQVTVTIPAGDTDPNAADPSARGRRLYIARQYTYRLSLLPGACTAIPANGDLDGNDEDMKWDDQGNLLTVPQGYTPIYNEEELRKIGVKNTDGDYNYTNSDGKNYEYSLSANYILMTDINLTPGYDPATGTGGTLPDKDFNDIPDEGNTELWTPIGNEGTSTSFKGHFNGNGHTITGMTINTSTLKNAGFFGYTSGAVIYNLHMKDARVKNMNNNNKTGSLIGGCANGTTVSLCSATGCAVSGNETGGLIGETSQTDITLTRCHATDCKVSGTSYSGGLIGYNSSVITACYVRNCDLSGCTGYHGGLVGCYSNAILFGCYTSGNTFGSNTSASLVGSNYGSIIASAYAVNATKNDNSGDATTIGLITENKKSNNDLSPTLSGLVSPFKESSSTGNTDTNGEPTGFGFYWGAGYQQLLVTGADKDTAEGVTTTTKPLFALDNEIRNDCTFNITAPIIENGTVTTAGNTTLTNVSTVMVNTTGNIYAQKRNWTAAGIWGATLDAAAGNTVGSTDATKKVILAPPIIQWSYQGEQ